MTTTKKIQKIPPAKSKFKIMVVDDDPSITLLMSAMLKEFKYNHEVYNDPVLALREFLKKPYHLLITDIDMPFMDGFELIKRLRLERPSCDFIVVTGNKSLENVSRSQHCGASHIFFKPVEPADLKSALAIIYDKYIYWRNQVIEFEGAS